jgi:hypothetical protein
MYVDRVTPELTVDNVQGLADALKNLRMVENNPGKMLCFSNTVDGLLKQLNYAKTNLLKEGKSVIKPLSPEIVKPLEKTIFKTA